MTLADKLTIGALALPVLLIAIAAFTKRKKIWKSN